MYHYICNCNDKHTYKYEMVVAYDLRTGLIMLTLIVLYQIIQAPVVPGFFIFNPRMPLSLDNKSCCRIKLTLSQ